MNPDLTRSIDLVILKGERCIRLIQPLLAIRDRSWSRRWLNDDARIWQKAMSQWDERHGYFETVSRCLSRRMQDDQSTRSEGQVDSAYRYREGPPLLARHEPTFLIYQDVVDHLRIMLDLFAGPILR